jgi:hypothetical protein
MECDRCHDQFEWIHLKEGKQGEKRITRRARRVQDDSMMIKKKRLIRQINPAAIAI